MFADVNGIRMFYSDTGGGSPVILIPGFAADHRFWKDMIPELSDHRVISVDNRGVGRTEYSGRFGISDLADDIIALADHLGIGRFAVVGWSMGTHISESLCERYPTRVSHCTLVSPYLRRPSRTDYLLSGFAGMLSKGEIPKEALCMLMNALCLTERDFIGFEDSGRYPSCNMDLDADGLIDQLHAVGTFDPTSILNSISVPTLVIHGSEDCMVPLHHAEETAARLKDSRFVIVDGAGHRMNPALYADLIREFISN